MRREPDSEIVQLSPKIIDLLLYLVARPAALVSKDDLFKALWPDVAVTDNALTQAVSELRQALGDDPSKPTYVQTVARRGYRFIAPVTTTAATQAATDRVPASEADTQIAAISRATAGDCRPRLHERQQRPRAGVAILRHR